MTCDKSYVMEPTLRQLEYVVAIAECGSFGRAAERCYVTQPALSAQVAQLERALGVKLFERGRRVKPTEAGEAVIEQATRILGAVRGLSERARTFRDPLSGRLRLGVIPTVSPYLLPRLFRGLRATYPHLRLTVREAMTRDLVSALHAGDLDLLLIALDVEMGPVEEVPLLTDPFRLLTPVDHAFADRDRISERELDGQRVMLLEDGHCLRAHAIAACHLRRAPDSDDFSAASLGTLVRLVEEGAGVTLLPQMAVADLVRADAPLRLLRFEEPEPGRRIGMVWRRGHAREHEFRMVVEEARRLLAHDPAGAVDR